jgi:hypothetical protein
VFTQTFSSPRQANPAGSGWWGVWLAASVIAAIVTETKKNAAAGSERIVDASKGLEKIMTVA